jgi:cobalt/nickel transport system permease protein
MTEEHPRASAEGLHRHPHEHDGELHEHVHHHASEVHEHGHIAGVERFAWRVSVLHALDPRAKLVAAGVLVLAVVLSPPLRPLEFALLCGVLLAAALVGRLPLGWVLKRTALVIPIAGTIALFAPLAHSGGALTVGGVVGSYAGDGWVAAWAIVSKAWLSVLVTVVLSGTTPAPQLIRGLQALRMPAVFVTLFSFIYRYLDVFRSQLRSLHTALDSRAPSMGRLRRWRVYGNLGGNLFIRAYDRGERIHAAMLSRGFDGTLPSAEALKAGPGDLLLLAVVLLIGAAVALY